jgi:hypothetical protein
MNPLEPSTLIDETSARSVVRIDAQEEEYVAPIREYLETNGCEVYVNQTTGQSPAYHIASGDLDFVKSIFSVHKDPAIPKLGIVFNSSISGAQKVLEDICKIVVVDPVHITSTDVMEIFSFFFAGNTTALDKRRNRHEPASHDASQGGTAATGVSQSGHVPDTAPITPAEVTQKSQNDNLPSGDRERIGNIISDVYKDEKHLMQDIKVVKHRRRKVKKSFWMTLAFILFVCIFPVIWYGASVGVTSASFALAAQQLKQNNTTGAGQCTALGNYWLHQAKFSFGIIAFPFHVLGFDSAVRGQERLVSFLSDVSSSLGDTFVIVKSGKDVATLLLTNSTGNSTGSSASAVDKLRISVVSVSGTLGLAEAQLSTLLRDKTFPFQISPIAAIGEQTHATLITLRTVLGYIDELLTLYPNVAGFKEPKTYLVLLQNSNELRPTGGFIGSVAIVKFDSGIMSDFTIQDVYALDGQLKGHVDPPVPIRELMGQEHWYLRDSNWDPDFKESAARAAWFYEKESGTTVDGVIAVNVPVIVDILSATGPVLLSDYNDTISAENFFGKSFYYTQNDFFPGSTQKSDFLGTLARTLVTKLTSDKSVNSIAIFKAVTAGLMRKDIVFNFTDSNIQQLVEHFGWGGRVSDGGGCDGVEKDICTFDPFIFTEANVSVSKVNYFVKRSAVREITIAPDGGLTESWSVTIRNTSDASNVTPGIDGTYKPYIRFLVPSDVQVHDVTLDGQPIHSRDPKLKGVPVIPYVENTTTSSLRGVGVAMEVPAGTQRTLRITVSRSQVLPFGRGGSVLDLMYYKHPGISDEAVNTIIRYPLYWSVTPENITQTFLAKEGQLEYNSTILQDQIIRLRFTK